MSKTQIRIRIIELQVRLALNRMKLAYLDMKLTVTAIRIDWIRLKKKLLLALIRAQARKRMEGRA